MDSPKNAVALRGAVACIAQWRAVVWCRGCSVHPDTEALAAQYDAVRQNFPVHIRPAQWLGTAGARKRGTRLRHRWGRRYCVVRPARLPHEVLEKVCQALGSWNLVSLLISNCAA